MVAAACHVDLTSAGTVVPMFAPFEPGWVTTLLTLLEIDGVFDAPFASTAKLFIALSAWRSSKLQGGALPAAAIMEHATFNTVALTPSERDLSNSADQRAAAPFGPHLP